MPTWSYPSSWTAVCNQALGRIGDSLLENVSVDTTAQAGYCRLFLGDAIDKVLGGHEWRSATKRTQLALLSAAPTFGFDHAYQLPTDCVLPYSIDTGGAEYSIENKKVLTDADEVFLAYVARPADPTELVPTLRIAIEARLAVMLSSPLGKSDQKTAEVTAAAAQDLNAALVEDGHARYTETVAEELGFTWNDELR